MIEYQLEFSRYKLRDYEKYIALKEFENQFPSIKNKKIEDKGILFSSNIYIDENKLKKLTFFSKIYIQKSDAKKVLLFTDQTIIENFHNYETNLFNEICPSKAKNIRYLTHSLHEYKGRFYPQLVKAFFNYAGIKNGETVLDPFCGSGTTLVESYLYGVNAVGVDINPIAHLLTEAKIRSLSIRLEDLSNIKNAFDNLSDSNGWQDINISSYNRLLDINYLENWFPINNLKKIIFIKETIGALPDATAQLLSNVVLSNLIKEFSYQDPTQLRIRRRIEIPPTNLIEVFKKNLNKHIDNLEKFQILNRFELNSEIRNYLGDIRTLLNSAELEKNSIDLVVTSPPYATALPYIDTDRLSLFAFGYTKKNNFRRLEESLIGNREITKANREILDKELESSFVSSILPKEIISLLKKIYLLNKNSNVGFRRKNTAALLYKYFLDMNLGFEQIAQVLKKNKYAFFVVGNNRTTAGNEVVKIPTDDLIVLIATNNNFKLIEKICLDVPRSYMIHSRNSINTESIIIFKRI